MRKFLFTAIFAIVCIVTQAQPKRVLADKIIATVGDKIVLKSEIDNSLADMQRQGINVPENGRCLLLEQALGIKALVVQAEKDSLPLSNDEIDAEIDNKIRYFIQQYQSKEALEQVAGKSVFQLKEDMKDNFREQKLAQSMRNKIVDEIRITPTEVKTYFDKFPVDSLPFYESQVEIGQVVIYPKPSRELETYAIDQLKDFKSQVESGAKKFETLASLYTDDPGSKETGGKYDINKSEKQWDPTFLSKAFSLKEGQVSSVFKTRFGYHIIQMIARSGDDATIRHILKIPQVSSIEIAAAKEKLDSVRSDLVAGTIKFGEAVSKYSDDESSKFTGGRLTGKDGGTFLTIDQLDKDIVVMMKDLKIGQYSQPIEYTDEKGKKGVRIVKLVTRSEPHRQNLKDDYNKIAVQALEEKKNGALEKWFLQKIPSYYIDISPEYQSCSEMKKWMAGQAASTLK